MLSRSIYNGTTFNWHSDGMMNDLILVIGNKNYSSWSLRPWLFLRKNQLPFTEHQLWLDEPEFKSDVAVFGSGGKVPVMMDGGEAIWDSLAIIETAIDRYDCRYGWPEEPRMRAHARSAAGEMHSGFISLRGQCPMDIRGHHHKTLSLETLADIERISYLWTQAMDSSGDNTRWLYGDFSAADAMFAPVVSRFHSYGVSVTPAVQRYMDFAMADPDLAEWIESARQESRSIAL